MVRMEVGSMTTPTLPLVGHTAHSHRWRMDHDEAPTPQPSFLTTRTFFIMLSAADRWLSVTQANRIEHRNLALALPREQFEDGSHRDEARLLMRYCKHSSAYGHWMFIDPSETWPNLLSVVDFINHIVASSLFSLLCYFHPYNLPSSVFYDTVHPFFFFWQK